MSGPAIHHVVAQKVLEEVLKARYTDADSTRFWSQLSGGQLGPIYLLGAQGPDFLFFNMSDWPLGGAVKTLAQTYWEVQKFLEELVDEVKRMIPAELWAAIDTLEGLAEDAVERSATLTEIEQLFTDVKNNIAAIKALVLAKLEELVTDSVDLFGLLKHPQQHGQPLKDWWWFDTLHIRRTGRFAHTLLRKSSQGSAERAYALGYLTHYASDAVGHPFVNIISGGPYRTHSQRHKVAENHQDTWALNRYLGQDLPSSNLARDYVIQGDDTKLPPALNAFLLSCVKKVYFDASGPLYGKKIGASDLDVAYRTWLAWFKRSTNDLGLPLPQPYSITGEIAEAWNQFVENAGDIGDYVGDSMSGGGGLLGLLKALAALVLGPILLAAAFIDFVLGTLTTLGAAPMRFFLSLSYQELYDAYLHLRKAIVLNGFAFPRIADLGDPLIQHMLHSGRPDYFGHTSSSLRSVGAYPASKFAGVPGMEPESHLIYPTPIAASGEPDTCGGAPDSYFSCDASWYIDGLRNRFRPDAFAFFRSFAETGIGGGTPGAVGAKYADLAARAAKGGLGSAVSLSEALYADFVAHGNDAAFPDFNLDSDRGYAFKSWRKVKDISQLNTSQFFNQPIEPDRQVPNVVDDVLYPSGSLL